MGASLEATLLECGVTSIVSTIDKPTQTRTSRSSTSTRRRRSARRTCMRPATSSASRSSAAGRSSSILDQVSRGARAVSSLGLHGQVRQQAAHGAIEALTEKTKRQISPATRWRRELQAFEEEAWRNIVDDDWVANEGEADEVSRRCRGAARCRTPRPTLLKKKSPHNDPRLLLASSVFPQSPLSWCALPGCPIAHVPRHSLGGAAMASALSRS